MGRKLALAAIVISVLAVLLLAAAGPGTRFGLWGFRTGLTMLRYVAFVGLGGAALGLIAAVWTRGQMAAVLAIVLGLAAFSVPFLFMRRAKAVPPIHDVSTDTDDPPRFVAVLPLRAGALNPADPPPADVVAQQKKAYPDLQPVVLAEPPDRAFARALDAAKSLGWEIDAAEPAQGRIEATDTTTWFGFKDDVVIRVRPDGGGSRVDVRSVSRVGKSDVGANAARIRRYLERVRTAA